MDGRGEGAPVWFALGPYFITGGVVLVGNAIAGVLWDAYGAATTFLTGAGLSVVAILGLALLRARPAKGR